MSELADIRKKFNEGALDHIKKDLENFITMRREEILNYLNDFNKRNPTRQIDEELAIKFFILKTRTINAKQEITEQLREIEREKWIQGVKLQAPPNPVKVAEDWASKFSPGWRDHRVTIIVFIFDQDKQKYLNLLKGTN